MKQILISLLVLLLVVVGTLWWSGRGQRLIILHKLASNPRIKNRVALVPSHKEIANSTEAGKLYDFGSFSFSLPRHLKLGAFLWDEDAAVIALTNEFISIRFLEPFERTNIDEVRREIDIEKTLFPNFHTTLLMRPNDFQLLVEKIKIKGGTTRGWNQIYSFSRDNLIGLVRIGDKPADKLHESVSLSAKKKNIGFHIELKPNSAIRADELIVEILSSFRFAEDQMNDKKVLRATMEKKIQEGLKR